MLVDKPALSLAEIDLSKAFKMLSASLPRRWLLPPDLRDCSPSPLRTSRRRTRRGRASSERAPGDDALRLERGSVKSEATRVVLVLLCGLRATSIHITLNILACTISSFERISQQPAATPFALSDAASRQKRRLCTCAIADKSFTEFKPSAQAQIRKTGLTVVPAVRSTTSSPASSLSRFSWQTQQNQSPSGRASRFAQ